MFDNVKNGLKTAQDFARDFAKRTVASSVFLSDQKAEAGKVIEFAITIIIVAAIIPAALGAIFGTNTSTWDASTIAIWGVFGVIIVAVIVLMLYNTYGQTGGRGGM